MILVDTNVFSELQKTLPDPRVVAWLHDHRNETVLSTVVIAEIALGIRITPSSNKRDLLDRWLKRLIERHVVDRILPFDVEAAKKYGEVMAGLLIVGRHAGVHDGQIAAQALAHGLAIATRNAKDFRHEGIDLIDPWEA
jgi:toxin FitB